MILARKIDLTKVPQPSARVIGGDPLIQGHAYEKDGQLFHLIREGHSYYLFLLGSDGETREIGRITPGSVIEPRLALRRIAPVSGAIYLGQEPIGEYSLEGDFYRIIPYKDGLRQLENIEQLHPLDYLLSHVKL